MSRAWNISLLVVLAGLASGCALGGSQEEPLRDGLLARSSEGTEDEMTAIVGGTVELDPDRGCVLLSGRPVVWPFGTTLTLDPPELHLPGGLRAKTGDTIAGGGGYIPATAIRETRIRILGDLTAALECAPTNTDVVVLQARAEMTCECMRAGSSSELKPRVFTLAR